MLRRAVDLGGDPGLVVVGGDSVAAGGGGGGHRRLPRLDVAAQLLYPTLKLDVQRHDCYYSLREYAEG